MNSYCTLFDSNYLVKGLAMYNSLQSTGEEFILYIFPFDDLAERVLLKMQLQHVHIVPLKSFETAALLEKRRERTRGEYCWTCTSFVIAYVLEEFQPNDVTYIDADLYFFQQPDLLLREFRASGNDVLLTEHRYTPEYDKTETSGIYCVQFMTFKNTAQGWEVLRWWQQRCMKWCYARSENGKFGDQKYLDDWLIRFTGVHVLKNLGGGVAPWNIQQYRCGAGPTVDEQNVIFFHFHGVKFFKSVYHVAVKSLIPAYRVDDTVAQYLYLPYIAALKKAFKEIKHCTKVFVKMYDCNAIGVKDYLKKRAERGLTERDTNIIMKQCISVRKRTCQDIVIFGAGQDGFYCHQWLKRKGGQAGYFVDNACDKQGGYIDGIPICSPAVLLEQKERIYVLIATVNYQEEIARQLQEMGFSENVDYVTFEKLEREVLNLFIKKHMKWILQAPRHG